MAFSAFVSPLLLKSRSGFVFWVLDTVLKNDLASSSELNVTGIGIGHGRFRDGSWHGNFLIASQGHSVEVRQAAGLLLKNNLKTSYAAIAPAYQHYIKAELLPCLGASDRNIRATVGTVISVVVQQVHVQGWPEIFQAIAQCLDSNDFNHMEGALDALSKVCSLFPFLTNDCSQPARDCIKAMQTRRHAWQWKL